MFEYKLIKINEGNIHYFKFDNQFEACISFMRMQEFYESPDPDIRGHRFDVLEFMDSYAKREGNFTYTTDWHGFNIPGNFLINWYNCFADIISTREFNLLKHFKNDILNKNNFYVIGSAPSADGAVIDHELCHAFYYLDKNFYENAFNIVASNKNYLSVYNQNKIFDKLREKGYSEEVLFDELIAYLATSSKYYIKDSFGMNNKNLWEVRRELKKLFIQYTKKHNCYDLLRYKK